MSNPFPYMPSAESYFYRGGDIGCLCLHGFMASPAEVRWLGMHLAAHGMTVYIPRLPGHGTDYHDMSRMRWQDWLACALDGDHILRQQCQRVFVAGLSMGGLLALLLATCAPVDGLAVMASPAVFQSRQMAYAHWFKVLAPYTHQPDTSNLPQIIRQEQARRGEPVVGRVRYDDWSTNAVGELYTLAQVARSHLPQVRAPLLLVYSENDRTVPVENMSLIADEVKSALIERQLLHTSDHILVQDVERETVFALVADFIARQSQLKDVGQG